MRGSLGITQSNRLTVKSDSFLLFIVYFAMFWGIIHDFFMVPGAALFIIDFALLSALLVVSKKKMLRRNNRIVFYYILIYLLFVVISYILNFQSIFNLVFGLRNNFRFYLFFLLCISSINEKTAIRLMDNLDVIFYINAIVLFVQRFIFDYEQDLLGGIFGVSSGCNGSLNVFLVIITAKTLINTLEKKENLRSFAFKCCISLIIAALTELKIYFFEFALILAFSIIVSRFSFRKVWLALGSIFVLLVGVEVMVFLYPGFAGFFSYDGAMRIVAAGSYSESSAFNRFTFVPFLNEHFLTTLQLVYMGMGIGNCELSSFSLFDTMFHHQYEWTHYDWFQSTFTYLEQGMVGLVLLVFFFILVLMSYIDHYKKNRSNGACIKISVICSVISIILVFYNQSMRTEVGYLMYFVLSVPFILKNYELKSNPRNKQLGFKLR